MTNPSSQRTKPKCAKGTACGYSCISGKYRCSSKILARDAEALVASIQASGRGGHTYTASLDDDGLKTPDNTWAEVRETVAKQQLSDLTRITSLSEDSIAKGIAAITAYTSADYRAMRAADSSEPGLKPGPRYTELVEDMNVLVSKLPKYFGKIERGLSFSSEAKRESFLLSIDNGLQLEAMSSFSSDSGVSNTYAGKANGVVLSVAENSAGASIKPFATVKGESEVIVQKGVKYKVLRQFARPDGVVQVDLEEI